MVNVDGLPNVVREAGLSATGQELPLSGLDILAFEHMMAGPFATQILADLGATVVKVEPFRGESARYAHPMLEGEPDPFGFMFMRSSAYERAVISRERMPDSL